MKSSNDLVNKKCVPCEGGVDPFNGENIAAYLPATPTWKVVDEKAITKEFTFKNFKEAIGFINKIAEIAESEGHHPDINLHGWNNVALTLSTHAIKGLSENDFILAAKIDVM